MNKKLIVLATAFVIFFVFHDLHAKEFLIAKSNLINMRIGPGTNYPIKFVYKLKNIPFMVTLKFENWYKVQDIEGDIGWIHANLLKKGDYVMTIKKEGLVYGYKIAKEDANNIKFTSESKVIFKKKECKNDFCKLKKDNQQGWVMKNTIWGLN